MATKKNFTKYNYIDVVQTIVPELYRIIDYKEYGESEDISYSFLGRILRASLEHSNYMDVSGETASSFSRFFSPNYKTSDCTSKRFETFILGPYNKKLVDFKTQDELTSWVSATLLPDTTLNNPSGFYSVLSAMGSSYSSVSATHDYLLDNLGLYYALNSSSVYSVDGSSLISSAISEKIHYGVPLKAVNGIELLFKWFWENKDDPYIKNFFPPSFLDLDSNVFSASGTFDNDVLSLINIHINTWLSDSNKDPDFVDSALDAVITSEIFPEKLRDAGPFQRFLKAVSLGLADYDNIVEDISQLLDIDTCPEQFLEFLGYYIGWEFITGDIYRWRAQLRDAVIAYKTKGSVLGLEAVLKLIFPTGLFSKNDIVECWEHYIPNMLYYLLKTDSFLERNRFEGLDTDIWNPTKVFGHPLTGDLTWNTTGDFDTNIRFMVDFILENMHNTFGNIKWKGVNFKESDFITCQGLSGSFNHRGREIAVPPWEKYGFYKETRFTEEIIDYLGNILSGTRQDYGFEVPASSVTEFKETARKALDLSSATLSSIPQYGLNNEFRFFTSGHALPPNQASIVDLFVDNDKSHTNLFDYWSTRSSHVFTILDASGFDWFAEDYDSTKSGAALNSFRKVLAKFIPLHVTPKIIIDLFLEDDHCVTGTMCARASNIIDEYNTGFFKSYNGRAFLGGSGTGNISGTYINPDGRELPVSGGDFWSTTATNLYRNTGRRRGHRYALPQYPLTREGKAHPNALNHFKYSTSGSAPDLSATPYLNTWEYILKGFDYEYQGYVDMSSSIWDSDRTWYFDKGDCNYDTCTISGIETSSTYPVRGVPETDFACSSWLRYRNNTDDVLKAMIKVEIMRYGTSATFEDNKLENFEWGSSYTKAYNILNDTFNGLYRNYIDGARPFYGGYNFASYAYGPGMFNHDFKYEGGIYSYASGYAGAIPLSGTPFGHINGLQFSSIVGGSDALGQEFIAYDKSITELKSPYFSTTRPTITTTEDGEPSKITSEILSGIRFEQPYESSKSFCVVSNPLCSYGTTKKESIAMYNRDKKPIRVIIPFESSATQPLQKGFLSNTNLRLDLCAKIKSLTGAKIQVKIITGPVSSSEYRWGFNFKDDVWEPYYKHEKFLTDVPILRTNNATIKSVDFHTIKTITNNHPCDTKSPYHNWNIHTSSTDYYVILTAKEKNNGAIIINNISIQDIGLHSLISELGKYELHDVFQYWTTLGTDNYYSRNKTLSESTFETSGGSRGVYLETLGGDLSGVTNSTVTEFSVED